MIYLSGHVRAGWPAMLTPMMGNRVPDSGAWAADTGCFARPEAYSDDWYLAWLEARRPMADRCLFAAAPDRFGDGAATLAVALPMLPRIRAAGYRAALVLQPGMTPDAIPWSEVDAVFVGGPNHWQHSEEAASILRTAHQRGTWIHVGRVNTRWRIRWARSVGADSADGTCLRYGPDKNEPLLRAWLAEAEAQHTTWDVHDAPTSR